jgi:hypothetical protein
MSYRVSNLYIKSRNRISGTAENFTIALPITVQNVVEIELLHVHIPNTIYNIVDAINELPLIYLGNQYVITVPPGYYTICCLLQTLQALINQAVTGSATSNLFLLSYDSVTFKVTIQTSNGVDFTINFETAPPSTIGHAITGPLGFGHDKHLDYTSVNGVLTAPFAIDLNLFDQIYIVIKEAGSQIISSNIANGDYPTFVIPVDVDHAKIIQWNTNSHYPQKIYLGNIDFTILNISLQLPITAKGVTANISRILPNNGSEWAMLLKITSQNQNTGQVINAAYVTSSAPPAKGW